MSKKDVEVKLLLNEHATHKYEMRRHLKTFMYDLKKRRRSARIQAKVYTVSKDLKMTTRHLLFVI